MGLSQIKKVLHSKGDNYQKSRDNLQNGRKSLLVTHQIKD
jgi:hypothetical protein